MYCSCERILMCTACIFIVAVYVRAYVYTNTTSEVNDLSASGDEINVLYLKSSANRGAKGIAMSEVEK